MREFFKHRRRKIGCVTLLMACVITAAWIRSHEALDGIYTWHVEVLSLDGVLVVQISKASGPQWPFFQFGSVGISQLLARFEVTKGDWNLKWFGFRCGISFIGSGWLIVVPHWMLIVPLIAVSAKLLLSKRTLASKKSIESLARNMASVL